MTRVFDNLVKGGFIKKPKVTHKVTVFTNCIAVNNQAGFHIDGSVWVEPEYRIVRDWEC